MRVTRRHFLAAGAASAAGVCLYTWRVEPHWIEIVRRALPIRNLPPALAGRTLVQISDIHVGPRVDDGYVLDAFARVASLRADIIVVTGDLVSHHAAMFEQMEYVYRRFPRGRVATLGILGNHDYGAGWSQPEVAARVANIAEECGITVLRNAIHVVDGLQIGGLDDWWARRFDASLVVPRLESGRAALVLSHNPDTADLPVWDGYEGWILSGHTHGGQCKPPFLPPPLLPVRNRTYTSGEFALSGNRRLYINRGIGHLLRVRFSVRPEITVFELSESR